MNNSLLHVCVGDIVEVCFDHCNPPQTLTMRVEVVERRYGNNRDGSKMNPLVAGVDVMTMKNEICDLSFVTRVISKTKLEAPKRNVFREAFNDGYRVGKMDKCWVGSLCGLATQALSELDLELDRYIHEVRLQDLYEKSHMGFVGYLSCYNFKVNPKKFTKWVAKNWHRILMTSSEMHELANKRFEQERRELDADMRRMWQTMMDDELDQQDEDDADIETELVR